jgi:hypothetical protein
MFLSTVAGFLTRPSVFAATLVLGACLVVSPARAANEPLMPTGIGGGTPDDGVQPFDPNPAVPGSPTRTFLTYRQDADGHTIPKKTIRITNNTNGTVYPIMRDPNTNVLQKDPTTGLYDPYDPPNKEYRGFIGYVENGKYYFGLKKGQSILVDIPLVFWNGARVGIGTEGEYVWRTANPNPLRTRATAHRSITMSADSADSTASGSITNGVVMWYRNDALEGPNDDVLDQLAEFTIRDHDYLATISPKTGDEIPDTQIVTLINYDISNVDTLFLPLALAANDVWVFPNVTDPAKASNPNRPNQTGGYTNGSKPEAVGWTGAVNDQAFLHTHIKSFTAGNNALLGTYFGATKPGWPRYNIPNPNNDPDPPIKIPSGANVFAESPLLNKPGSYGNSDWRNDKFMLSSGGTEPVRATGNWSGVPPADQPGSVTLHLLPPASSQDAKDILDFIHPGYLVTGNPNAGETDPIKSGGTTVVSIDRTTGVVTLKDALVNTSDKASYSFTRPVHDYAAEAMIRLWYSWEKYYRDNFAQQHPSTPSSPFDIQHVSIGALSATMSFQEPHPELAEGMAVTGPGLDGNTMTEVGHVEGPAIILEIAPDKKSVIVSQVPATGSTDATFTFSLPPQPRYAPVSEGMPGYPLFGDNGTSNFAFGAEPAWRDPYKFSQTVYLVMASMNQVGITNSDTVCKFMQNIIGGNMGFIFTQAAKDSDDGKMLQAKIRDKIKSALRGVSDFTEFGEVDETTNTRRWYPNPAEDQGGKGFNVFNLDPFVWFVHVQLGFTGYGFSLDDDTAQVGAGGASHLQLSVTGTNGLQNKVPWAITAPWGPVVNIQLPYSGPADETHGDTQYYAISNISTGAIKVTTPAAHGLANGDTIRIDQVLPPESNANGKFKVGNVTKFTFDLFDEATGTIPVQSNGAATGGRWTFPLLHPYVDTVLPTLPGNDLSTVFYRVLGDDALKTFQGVPVSVNGVSQNPITKKKFRVWQLGQASTGRLIFDANLTDAGGGPLSAGTYTFTFGATSTPSPTPTPAPGPRPNPGVISQAQKDIRTLKRNIMRTRNSQPGPARKQALTELRFSRRVANTVIADSTNPMLDNLLDRVMKATKIKNDKKRGKLFRRLRKQFQRLR